MAACGVRIAKRPLFTATFPLKMGSPISGGHLLQTRMLRAPVKGSYLWSELRRTARMNELLSVELNAHIAIIVVMYHVLYLWPHGLRQQRLWPRHHHYHSGLQVVGIFSALWRFQFRILNAHASAFAHSYKPTTFGSSDGLIWELVTSARQLDNFCFTLFFIVANWLFKLYW